MNSLYASTVALPQIREISIDGTEIDAGISQPRPSLNTTDDSVDPEASGFIVNQNTATNINVNGGQYIFLAIA